MSQIHTLNLWFISCTVRSLMRNGSLRIRSYFCSRVCLGGSLLCIISAAYIDGRRMGLSTPVITQSWQRSSREERRGSKQIHLLSRLSKQMRWTRFSFEPWTDDTLHTHWYTLCTQSDLFHSSFPALFSSYCAKLRRTVGTTVIVLTLLLLLNLAHTLSIYRCWNISINYEVIRHLQT